MTLKELADLTGVSVATISRVVNEKEGVSDRKREEIWEKLKEVGYEGKAKKKNKKQKIAFISTNLENEFFAEILRKIIKVYLKRGVEVVVYDTFETFEIEYEIVSSFEKNEYDGVFMCICDPEKSFESIEKLRERDIPFVLYDRELDRNSDGVFSNDFEAGIIAGNHMIEKGHKKILIVSGELPLRTVTNRVNGALYAAKMHPDIEIKKYEYRLNELESSYEFIKEVLKKEPEVTGIISAFRYLTMGIVRYLNEFNPANKEDIDIVGFDNPSSFDFLGLKIGNVTRSMNEMVKLCVELLDERMEKKGRGLKKYLVQPYLKK